MKPKFIVSYFKGPPPYLRKICTQNEDMYFCICASQSRLLLGV